MVPPFCAAIKPVGHAVPWSRHLMSDLSVIFCLGGGVVPDLL